MVEHTRFTVEEIIVPHDRQRGTINSEAVRTLAGSIKRLGLQVPLSVRYGKDDDGDDTIVLIAGLHRLEACKSLGWDLIDCVVFDGDEVEARLWEIAENLHRSELTVQEKSDHINEWIRLTEERCGVSAQVGPKLSTRGRVGEGRSSGGINAAVRDLPNVTRQEAQRSVKIAAIAPEAKAAAKEAGIADNQSALMRVAKAGDAAAQMAAVEKEKKKVKPPITEEQWLKAGRKWWKMATSRAWQERFIEEEIGL